MSHEALAQIVEATPAGMIVVDSLGTIQLANAEVEAMFGHAQGPLAGCSVASLLPERYRAGHLRHLRGYLQDPQRHAMGVGRELYALRADGSEFPVEIGLNAVTLGDRRMVIAAVSDISVRKQVELELRQANAQLEEFSYVASHDLKSPLRGISDLVDWVVEDLMANPIPSAQKNLERIKLRVARMEGIIDDLLTYARAGRASAELEEIDPKSLILGVLEVLSIPEKFEVHVEADMEPFQAARTPLETVLRNLVNNAVEHHDGERGQVEIVVRGRGAFCEFSVRDDGPGIPEAAQARIFELFQTVSASERGGSGIGLAVCKRLVECHGGSIEVKCEATRRGSTFTFSWPRFLRRSVDE
jgi:PAS domain S-box-containing protein